MSCSFKKLFLDINPPLLSNIFLSCFKASLLCKLNASRYGEYFCLFNPAHCFLFKTSFFMSRMCFRIRIFATLSLAIFERINDCNWMDAFSSASFCCFLLFRSKPPRVTLCNLMADSLSLVRCWRLPSTCFLAALCLYWACIFVAALLCFTCRTLATCFLAALCLYWACIFVAALLCFTCRTLATFFLAFLARVNLWMFVAADTSCRCCTRWRCSSTFFFAVRIRARCWIKMAADCWEVASSSSSLTGASSSAFVGAAKGTVIIAVLSPSVVLAPLSSTSKSSKE